MKKRFYQMLLLSAGLAAVAMVAVACAGSDGVAGTSGPAGSDGLAGTDGTDGTDGSDGAAGPAGSAGADGADGSFNAPAPAVKEFHVTAFEVKGATDGIDPPATNPKDLSDGYGFKPPGVYDSSNPAKWQVASYMWTPGAMTVLEGDTVDMTIFVLNGDVHDVWVESPSGTEVVTEFTMNRGRQYVKSFAASEAGVYRLICNTHEPTMTAYILVLPTS